MRGYRAVLENEVIELWRTYRLAITCGLFALLGIAVPILERYLRGITNLFGRLDPEIGVGRTGVPDVVDALVASLWLFGPIAGVLLANGSIAGERRAGTVAFVLARPVARVAFVWAKFVAGAMVLGLATALTVLATWLYTAILFGQQEPTAWVQLWLLAWLTSMVFLAITLAASASFASPAGAAALGIAAVGAINLASTVVTLNPWLPTGLGEIAKALVLAELGGDVDPFRTVAASLALLFAALAVAWLQFRRADL